MKQGGDRTTLERARQRRRDATLPERLLWAALRGKQTGLRFRRQHPTGPFILDFYCVSARLCVEIDDRESPAAPITRTEWIRKLSSLRCIRSWFNSD